MFSPLEVLVLDTETTGLHEPEANEIAWVELLSLETMELGQTFEKRYKPSKPSEFGALMTHNILESELVDCPPPTEFKLPKQTKYIIGHNIDYDWAVIGKPDVKRICTKALSSYLVPDTDSHRQSAMLYYFEGDKAREKLLQAHSALPDVMNCILVLGYLLTTAQKKFAGESIPYGVEDLYQLSEIARVPIKMPFGKHRGEAIKDTPASYKSWLLIQPDVDPYLRKALES